jgi:hypothetical protein
MICSPQLHSNTPVGQRVAKLVIAMQILERRNIMKKYIPKLKVMVLAGISILIVTGYAAAAQNTNIYKGELTSGSAKVGNLGSNELWLIYGEKGTRIVISTVVDKGKAPPQIYLYPPEGSKYEVHSDVVSDRSQVLDHNLDSTGKYEVLIRPCDPEQNISYQVAYQALAPGDSYTIQPDDPKGNLIGVKNLDKSETGNFLFSKTIPATIVLSLATFGFGPLIFALFTGVDEAAGGAVALNNRVEVASRVIEEPAGQCSTIIAMVGSR